jgi:hypothetical protein
VPAAAAAGYVVLNASPQPVRAADVGIGLFKGERAVLITNGSTSMPELARTLATRTGSRDAVLDGGVILLKTDVIVGRGGALTVGAEKLHLLSDATATVDLRVEGGSLTMSGADVMSWSPSAAGADLDSNDARSEIVAEGGGSRMTIERTRITALGSSAETPGLTWRTGASGAIKDSAVVGNFRGVYGYQSGSLAIAKTEVRGSSEVGIMLRKTTSASRVRDSTVKDNGAAGVQIVDVPASTSLVNLTVSGNAKDGISATGSNAVVIDGGEVSANKGSGLSVTDSISLDARHVVAWGNENGFALTNVHAELRGDILSGNVQDGLFVDDSKSTVRIADGRFDHNGRAGFWVADGSVALTKVVFDRNQTGLRMADSAPAIVVTDSMFIGNVKDGMAVGVLKGVSVSRSTFLGNRLAAFSAPDKTDLSPLLRDNTIGTTKQIAVRVRQETPGSN